MAKVYLSSTKLDLEDERRAVLDWLAENGHQRRHSYVAATERVRKSCITDVLDSDVYVLIVGHRYGHVPGEKNSERRSITELEYEAAIGKPMPIVVLQPTYVRNDTLTDIGKPAHAQVVAFRERVGAAHRPAYFADIAQLVSALGAALKRELVVNPLDDPEVLKVMAGLGRQNLRKDDQIEALQRENSELRAQLAAAVARTLAASEVADATPEAVLAASALKAGDSVPAQALLEAEGNRAAEEARTAPAAEAQVDRRRAAELARERGALALQNDVTAALAAYREAVTHDPEDLWSRFFVGDLCVAIGTLDDALESYLDAQRLASKRIDATPDDLDFLRDLSVSHSKIGDVRVAQGDLPAALQAFEDGLAIAQRLAARDPANTQWQRDLSVSHDRIGDVRVAQGDLPAALQAFEDGLAIRQRLAARDPANTQWQRDLSVSHNKIGDVRVTQGDLPAALQAFEDDLAIAQRLADRDPANVQWQVDVAVSFSKLGRLGMLSTEVRRKHLEQGLEILDTLAARNRLAPNQDWRVWFRERLASLA